MVLGAGSVELVGVGTGCNGANEPSTESIDAASNSSWLTAITGSAVGSVTVSSATHAVAAAAVAMVSRGRQVARRIGCSSATYDTSVSARVSPNATANPPMVSSRQPRSRSRVSIGQ